MRGISGRHAALLIAFVLLVTLTVGPVAPAAAVTNARIQAKRAEVAKVNARLDDLNDEFEMRVEEYNEAEEQLAATTAELKRTQALLDRTLAKLDVSEETLNSRAVSMYRDGGLDLVGALVGTASFEDLVTRIDLLNMISGADADLVSDVKGSKQRISEAKSALESRRAEEAVLRAQKQQKAGRVQVALGEQQKYLESLNSQIRKLVKEEQERQRRLAAERARLAAARSRSWGTPSRRTGTLGSPHPEAARAALRYVGVPYVWGGTSPNGFDCSGLCQYAYRQIGISIPRTSRSQYRVGGYIARNRTDLLEPGDLVFFGYGGSASRIHHVGMYVGGGDFVHAPGSGSHVRVESLNHRISSRGDYVGAVRP